MIYHFGKMETIKGKRLIGHSEKEDYYEDTKGNTYSYDGKRVSKINEEMSSGKQELWTHRMKPNRIWGRPNHQAPRKW